MRNECQIISGTLVGFQDPVKSQLTKVFGLLALLRGGKANVREAPFHRGRLRKSEMEKEGAFEEGFEEILSIELNSS